MDDVAEAVAQQEAEPQQQVETLLDYAGERVQTTGRIAIVIVTDAALFVIWIVVAWAVNLAANFAQGYGVDRFFAHAFMWVSSGSTWGWSSS